jgi:putative FmdB family regulatory protein
MHAYDYRCNNCQKRFTLTYKTYTDYDAATPFCPECGSEKLSRLITKIAIKSPSHDYASMEPDNMLSVLESGDSRQVGEMFKQVMNEAPADDVDSEMHEVTDRLLKGESMDRIAQDMEARDQSGTSSGDGGEA